jgi:heme/copper-type cytochrome/quinol oxidase subunit 2
LRRSLLPTLPRRRPLLLCCALTLLFGLALAPTAFANFASPQSGGSPNADRISNLYTITMYVAIVVFVGVEGTLLYVLIKFRAQGSRGCADPRQHAARDRLDRRRRGRPDRTCDGDLR